MNMVLVQNLIKYLVLLQSMANGELTIFLLVTIITIHKYLHYKDYGCLVQMTCLCHAIIITWQIIICNAKTMLTEISQTENITSYACSSFQNQGKSYYFPMDELEEIEAF